MSSLTQAQRERFERLASDALVHDTGLFKRDLRLLLDALTHTEQERDAAVAEAAKHAAAVEKMVAHISEHSCINEDATNCSRCEYGPERPGGKLKCKDPAVVRKWAYVAERGLR